MISLEYFLVLFISVAFYWIAPQQSYRKLILVFSSLLFIFLLDPWSMLVVLGLTLSTYAFGLAIYKYKKEPWIYRFGLILLILILAVFKYLGLLAGVFSGLTQFFIHLPSFRINHLLLLLGISYITFKHISYLTDVKWGLVKPGSLLDLTIYSSLFTIFVAGPIERFERLKPQIDTRLQRITWVDFDYAIMRILSGMVKKLVIADWLAYSIGSVLDHPTSYAYTARAVALLGYSMQIYLDFSGYSDIAIGSSRLFGLKIMENFNNPYLAPNISQFWRRWHISLSDWIRDYLFFPLSTMSSKKLWQFFAVPVLAMALCGIWHGASWSYAIWGIWHGLALSIYQTLAKRSKNKGNNQHNNRFLKYGSIMLTFSTVTLAWIFFRLPLSAIGDFFAAPIPGDLGIVSIKKIVLIMASFLLVLFVTPAVTSYAKARSYDLFSDSTTSHRWALIVVMIWLLIFAGNTGGQEFLYFRF